MEFEKNPQYGFYPTVGPSKSKLHQPLRKFPVRPFDDGLRSVDQAMHDKHRAMWDRQRSELKEQENGLLEKYWLIDESDDILTM